MLFRSTLKWDINTDAAYDWLWWDKSSLSWVSNGFSKYSDYTDSKWAPTYNSDLLSDFSLTMSKNDDKSGSYAAKDLTGKEIEGEYKVSGNTITFDQEITFLVTSNSNVGITTDVLKIVSSTRENGLVTEMWLGVPSKTNTSGEVTEYLCVKLKPQRGAVAESLGRNIEFISENLRYGDLEGKGNLRFSIYNEWGGHDTDYVVAPDAFTFDNNFKITFTINGIGELSEPVYANVVFCAGYSWDCGTQRECKITGDGTYTIVYDGSSSGNVNVFCVDIENLQPLVDFDLEPVDNKCPNLTVAINSITVDKAD